MIDQKIEIFDRKLEIIYWTIENRTLSPTRAKLEKHLQQLGQIQLHLPKTFDEALSLTPDIWVISALSIPEDAFQKWLNALRQRIRQADRIWTPALIIADMPFTTLNAVMLDAVQDNWYFDIISSQHLDSIPIRVANLVRIHDHLQELKRYNEAINQLSSKVLELEEKLEALKNN